MKYIMAAMCDNCPFAEEGAGLQLRLSLGPGRWRSILKDLRKGQHFLCHKTTTGEESDNEQDEGQYKPNGRERICAGSRAYQASLGIVSDAEQIMERVLMMKKGL